MEDLYESMHVILKIGIEKPINGLRLYFKKNTPAAMADWNTI